jgi:signal transduction histidine kinase
MIDDIEPDNTNQLELIGMMKKSVVKLDNFIEDILQYSRNARTEVAKETIDFKQTIDDITNNLIHMDGAKEIKLKMEIEPDLTFVSDRARVNMILNNFISNSLKYKDPLKKHQFLGIQIKSSNDNAVITIEDNGIGINEKDNEKIFDMFYRGTNTSTGSGLGLYIVKEAIHKLDGSIKMESELTKGTKFIVTLPNQLLVLNKKDDDYETCLID